MSEVTSTGHDTDDILAMVNPAPDALEHDVQAVFETSFCWDYERSRPALGKLYEKAKTAQWNAALDLDWTTDVDQEAFARENSTAAASMVGVTPGSDLSGTPFAKWGDKEWRAYGIEAQNFTLSQFLHGEQGALLCTARIVESVPWIDAKYYAATQAMDEARHVEVFSRYLDTKLSGHYPINVHLEALLDDILTDSRWDITYLGMQVMVEGLALAAFGFIRQLVDEPLLKELLRLVMSDEARHVAFGVLSLQEFYRHLSAAELRERQEFAFDAAVRLRDRFLQQEVWERVGVDVHDVLGLVKDTPQRSMFQSMLFSKIVPNCRKLGLLDAGDGWLRQRFAELGILQFETLADTGEEYEAFNAVTAS